MPTGTSPPARTAAARSTGQGNRLFHQHMLACIQRVQRHLCMETAGHTDTDSIDVVAMQQGRIVGVGGGVIFPAKMFGAAGALIRHRDQV